MAYGLPQPRPITHDDVAPFLSENLGDPIPYRKGQPFAQSDFEPFLESSMDSRVTPNLSATVKGFTPLGAYTRYQAPSNSFFNPADVEPFLDSSTMSSAAQTKLAEQEALRQAIEGNGAALASQLQERLNPALAADAYGKMMQGAFNVNTKSAMPAGGADDKEYWEERRRADAEQAAREAGFANAVNIHTSSSMPAGGADDIEYWKELRAKGTTQEAIDAEVARLNAPLETNRRAREAAAAYAAKNAVPTPTGEHTPTPTAQPTKGFLDYLSTFIAKPAGNNSLDNLTALKDVITTGTLLDDSLKDAPPKASSTPTEKTPVTPPTAQPNKTTTEKTPVTPPTAQPNKTTTEKTPAPTTSTPATTPEPKLTTVTPTKKATTTPAVATKKAPTTPNVNSNGSTENQGNSFNFLNELLPFIALYYAGRKFR